MNVKGLVVRNMSWNWLSCFCQTIEFTVGVMYKLVGKTEWRCGGVARSDLWESR